MSRVRINQYKASKSARELANYLGVTRLKTRGSRFTGSPTDTIINWGNGKGNIGNARQINKLSNVQLASNKLSTLQALRRAEVSIPRFYTNGDVFESSLVLYGRSDLYGHSGRGIHVGTYNEIPNCPLYVEAISKVAEYRAIVVGNKVVDFKKKKKKNTPEGEERVEHDEHVWNLDGGYIFARNDFVVPYGAAQLGIDAVSALGLDFGAVDIIEDSEGKLYVLEVNTAFGIEGTTLSLVGDAIKELI